MIFSSHQLELVERLVRPRGDRRTAAASWRRAGWTSSGQSARCRGCGWTWTRGPTGGSTACPECGCWQSDERGVLLELDDGADDQLVLDAARRAGCGPHVRPGAAHARRAVPGGGGEMSDRQAMLLVARRELSERVRQRSFPDLYGDHRRARGGGAILAGRARRGRPRELRRGRLGRRVVGDRPDGALARAPVRRAGPTHASSRARLRPAPPSATRRWTRRWWMGS